MTDNIEIKITDQVASSISTKLQGIAKDARSANTAVDKLQVALASLSATSPVTKLQTELTKLNTAIVNNATASNKVVTSNNAAALSQQKLATEIQKTQAATANVETALNKAVAAESKAAQSAAQLSAAKEKLAAQQAAASATAKVAAETDAQAAARIKAMVSATAGQMAANKRLGESERSLLERQGARVVATEAQRKAVADLVRQQSAQMAQAAAFIPVETTATGVIEANTAATVENAAAVKLNSRATSELGTLLGELASGNMGRMRQSTAALANQTGLLAKVFTTTGITILGTAAILATVISWAIKGYLEFQRLNTALIISGNSFGKSATEVSQLSNSMATINVNARQTNALFLGLISTGRATSETFATVGRAAQNMMALTGESVDQVVSSFDKLYSDPIAWADDMDTKWHFLTLETRDHAQALIDVGQKYAAAEVIAAAFADNTKSKVDELNASMGTLQRLMQRWSQGVANIKGAVFDIGVPKTSVQQFTELNDKYKTWLEETKGLDSAYIRSVDASYQARLKALQPAAEDLRLTTAVGAAQDENRKALLDSGAAIDGINDKTKKQFDLQNKLKKLRDSYQTQHNLGVDTTNDPTAAARLKGVSFDAQGLPSGGAYQSKVDELNKEANRGEHKDKTAERRSDALAKVNMTLDNEISLLGQLGPARELQAKYDQIEQTLQGKHITLTASESAAIKAKIAAVQSGALVQTKMNSIYEQATGPAKDYNATLKAANELLKLGVITQDQFNGTVLNAAEAYKTALDPLYAYNKDINEQINLLKLLPQQREVEQQVLQAYNESLAKNQALNETQIAQLRTLLELKQQTNLVSQQEASLLSNSNDKRQAVGTNISAIKNLQGDKTSGFTSGDAAGAAVSDLQSSGIDTTGFAEQSQTYQQQYQDMYAKINEYRQADLLSEQSAAAAKAQVFAMGQKNQLQSSVNFFGDLSSLMNTHNKTQFKIGKAAAIAQAGIQTYLGAVQAFTSLSAIPIVGPVLGAVAAAAAVAAGLAQIQNIRSQQMQGFQQGGYTGNAAQNAVTGVVHGQEFVSTAAATSQYRPQLEAMNRGSFDPAAPAGASGRAGGASAAPVVVPPASVRVVNVKSMDEARDFANSSENEQVVLNIMQRNGLVK